MDELAALAESAGVEPVVRVVVQRARRDPTFYIGSGKAHEIGAILAERGIALVMFDNDLSPAQQRNLERLWSVRVADRTDVILEIFAQRARSHEGKLQVELARLERQSSRLVRAWTHLERQQGGAGVRGGPGEKQIELDRRMIATRVRQLRERMTKIERQRTTRRRARQRRGTIAVSLVGYTNAGKSTLFRALTGADAYAANQLFATLDTLSRRLRLAPDVEVVLSDTVGFIRDLPHQLVAAFRATLEETASADLLLHVVDFASPDREEQAEQVGQVLVDIGAADVPTIVVCNKIDAAGRGPGLERDACGSIGRVFVSARDGVGLDLLRQALVEFAKAPEGSPAGNIEPTSPDAVAPDASGEGTTTHSFSGPGRQPS